MKKILSALVCLLSLSSGSHSVVGQAPPLEPPEVTFLVSPSPYTSASSIEVRFSDNIVTEDLVGQTAETSPIGFLPKLKGHFTWRSQRSGVFVPTAFPGLSRKFNAHTTEGLTALNGVEIPSKMVGTLETEKAKLTGHLPRYFARYDLPRRPQVTLFFNTNVNLESAERNVHFNGYSGADLA